MTGLILLKNNRKVSWIEVVDDCIVDADNQHFANLYRGKRVYSPRLDQPLEVDTLKHKVSLRTSHLHGMISGVRLHEE